MKKLFVHGSGNELVGKSLRVGTTSVIIEDVIAEGGFSIVYLAKTQNGKRVALKRMNVNNEEDLKVCQKEIIIMKKLNQNSKCIVKFFDATINQCSNNEQVYEVIILMEFCKAGHVVQLMNSRIQSKCTQMEVLNIFCDVITAVASLHHMKPPVAHRDLKVENILISDAGKYVLCDFGSATSKILHPSNQEMRQKIEEEIAKYTTLSYRAPEMVNLFNGKAIGLPADIWALGCILYKLCFFELPFGESSLAIQTGEFTIPDKSNFTGDIHRLIRFLLEPDTSKRPDIYQVAHFAFLLSGKRNPVLNTNNSTIPAELVDPLTKSQAEKKKELQKMREVKNRQDNQVVSETSIAPRRRPQGRTSTLGNTPNNKIRPSSHVPSNTVEPNIINANVIKREQPKQIVQPKPTPAVGAQPIQQNIPQNVTNQPSIPVQQNINAQQNVQIRPNIVQQPPIQPTPPPSGQLILRKSQLIEEGTRLQQVCSQLHNSLFQLQQKKLQLQQQATQQPALVEFIKPKLISVQQEELNLTNNYKQVQIKMQQIKLAVDKINQVLLMQNNSNQQQLIQQRLQAQQRLPLQTQLRPLATNPQSAQQ